MKIVVVGQDQSFLNNIKYDLSDIQNGANPIKIQTTRPSQINLALDHSTKLMILDVPNITNVVFQVINQVRKAGFSGPILLIGTIAADFDSLALAKTNNLHHVQRPYITKHFIQQVKGALTGENLYQRKAQRFSVYHPANVEAYNSDFKAPSVVNNISKGGLCMEGTFSGLKTGDLLKVRMSFDELQKERVMSARVVWLKKEGDNKEQAGLEFVSQKVVYDYLLSYALN